MKKLIGITLVTLSLSACGTAQGVMNGVGEVLTGMAVDARSVGSIFN
jgi:predicted small secreted protein